MFPLMKTMHNWEATAATECQDLMGMSFRTFHFDGVVRVPSSSWGMDCDMRETYTYHRRVLKLLQWHCKPSLWHLKTPSTFSLSMRSSMPTRTRNSCGAIAIRPR